MSDTALTDMLICIQLDRSHAVRCAAAGKR